MVKNSIEYVNVVKVSYIYKQISCSLQYDNSVCCIYHQTDGYNDNQTNSKFSYCGKLKNIFYH